MENIIKILEESGFSVTFYPPTGEGLVLPVKVEKGEKSKTWYFSRELAGKPETLEVYIKHIIEDVERKETVKEKIRKAVFK